MSEQTSPSGPQQVIFVFIVLTIALIGFWKLRPAPKPDEARVPDVPFRRFDFRPADDHQRHLAIEVVKGQLDAIKKGDYEKATSYNAVNPAEAARPKFILVDQFRQSVATEYSPLANIKTVRFGSANVNRLNHDLWLEFAVTGTSGRIFMGAYRMVWTNGVYRIADMRPGGRFRRF